MDWRLPVSATLMTKRRSTTQFTDPYGESNYPYPQLSARMAWRCGAALKQTLEVLGKRSKLGDRAIEAGEKAEGRSCTKLWTVTKW